MGILTLTFAVTLSQSSCWAESYFPENEFGCMDRRPASSATSQGHTFALHAPLMRRVARFSQGQLQRGEQPLPPPLGMGIAAGLPAKGDSAFAKAATKASVRLGGCQPQLPSAGVSAFALYPVRVGLFSSSNCRPSRSMWSCFFMCYRREHGLVYGSPRVDTHWRLPVIRRTRVTSGVRRKVCFRSGFCERAQTCCGKAAADAAASRRATIHTAVCL